MKRFALLACVVIAPQFCHAAATDSNGINSDVTGLDGTGVAIGHAEPSRVPKAGLDGDAFTTPSVVPNFVYEGASSSAATTGQGLNSIETLEHALAVGQILHGSDASGAQYQGVAHGAQLHSASDQIGDQGQLFTLQALARRQSQSPILGNRIRAINMSYGVLIDPFVEVLDGRSQFTQFVDWSAKEHDVTYVVAWPNFFSDVPSAPSDNHNGITVASSQTDFTNQGTVYDRFYVGNHDPDASTDAVGLYRTSIDLLAPGQGIEIIDRSENPSEFVGTSAATPHLTGAVAMLQQYATQQIAANNPAFDPDDSRQHQVMKAVLLNSADKLDGVHGSERTILRPDGTNWVEGIGIAYNRIQQPLDQFLGAGHLNVERAIEQFSGGDTGAGAVGDVGWDFQRSGGVGDRFSYSVAGTMKGGDYLVATLIWDKESVKTGEDDRFDAGDQFFQYANIDDVMSNLNLYLVPADSDDPNDAVTASISTDDNVEHIFFKVPEGGGEYKLIVDHVGSSFSTSDGVVAQSLDAQTDFAVAWWAYEPTSILPGDYNSDGDIDLDDHAVWVANYGSTVFSGRLADGNLDGVINAADYAVWRDAYDAASLAVSVPEPSSALLLLASVFGASRLSKARRCRA